MILNVDFITVILKVGLGWCGVMNYHQFWGERLETRSGLMKGVGVGSRKTSGPHFDLIPQVPQKIWVKCYWNWNSSNRRSVSKLPSKVTSPISFWVTYIHRVMVIFVMVKVKFVVTLSRPIWLRPKHWRKKCPSTSASCSQIDGVLRVECEGCKEFARNWESESEICTVIWKWKLMGWQRMQYMWRIQNDRKE